MGSNEGAGLDGDVVYLLVNREHSAFKIGMSNSPHRRLRLLPVAIDLTASFEFSILDGRARGAERVLHYLFRHERFEMPQGDGYTEWFDISVLPTVLAFVSANRERMGAGEVRPLRDAPVRTQATPLVRAAQREAKQLRVAARAEAAAIRRAAARDTNTERFAQLRAWFDQVDAEGAMLGLVRPRPGKPHADGGLLLIGPRAAQLADAATDVSTAWNTLVAPAGRMGIFSGVANTGSSSVEIWVNGVFFDNKPGTDEYLHHFPGFDEVRSFLIGRAAPLGSMDDHRLQRLRLRNAARIRRGTDELHQGGERA